MNTKRICVILKSRQRLTKVGETPALAGLTEECSSQVVTIHDAFFYDKCGKIVQNVAYGEP